MIVVSKGSKSDLSDSRYTITLSGSGARGTVDIAAVLLDQSGKVRSDNDFVFFNNPTAHGVSLISDESITVDLAAVPADVHRVVITGSTEAQNAQFGRVAGSLSVDIRGNAQAFTFVPDGLSVETVLQVVGLYRRGAGWRLDAIGQGYRQGLAAFATEHGIVVDEPSPQPTAVPAPSSPPQARPSQTPPASPINFSKVKVSLDKNSYDKTARIDLRKSQGDPSWVLTVGLEWDGRDAVYGPNGEVRRYGYGDLDVYFFCRNEETNKYVVISGESRHRGSLGVWPYIQHSGDSKGPGNGNKPATEQVWVKPNENGDLLVNVYQSVDNGTGAIDEFGKPRVAIRYGRAAADGLPGPDADEILVYVGNSVNGQFDVPTGGQVKVPALCG